ncbi:3-oxoacyl-[ACP] synthase [Enhygromyxa salina]|uniref:3-oxoacyl-[ACP] synthase n=1 Tax=Enhygromyxa salina TaxID=215803 RepID=A0A0C1ZXI4_9BACT|nr:beta-ketoacyl synthase chain length factor [Enhygromyxa salina]KIG15843.1 3-oxoacyl-[ACP] synthase [Enhygromyxa salina]
MSASLTDPLSGPRGAGRSATVTLVPREGSVELRARLRGVGMWTPAYANFDAWVAAGAPDQLGVTSERERDADADADADADPRPPAKLLHSRLRRRTSTLTRAAVTALEAAIEQGGASLDRVRFVLVSSFGEIETTVELLEQLAEPGGPVSPTKFHNSVHNTATGYMSIASGNHREATAIAGGPHNLDVGLLEALAGLAEVGGDVVLMFAEELLPAPFERADADPTFAVALLLSADPSQPSQPSQGLNLELRLTNGDVPAERKVGDAAGVGGIGLPTMIGPLVDLLRQIASARDGDGSAASQPLALMAGDDPGVESAWTVTLHSREHSG